MIITSALGGADAYGNFMGIGTLNGGYPIAGWFRLENPSMDENKG